MTTGRLPVGDLRVGVAWTELADPLVHGRVERAAALFGGTQVLELPLSHGTGPLFGRAAAALPRRRIERRDGLPRGGGDQLAARRRKRAGPVRNGFDSVAGDPRRIGADRAERIPEIEPVRCGSARFEIGKLRPAI